MCRLTPCSSLRVFALVAVLIPALLPGVAGAHVTPNVELVARGAFLRASLPEASQFFERKLDLDRADRKAIRQATGWSPSMDDTKVYVGRDADGALVGTGVFVWTPSQHGPVAVGVVFDSDGVIVDAAVTEVGGEPLSWVQPLVDGGGMACFQGLTMEQKPDAGRLAPEVEGKMSRYYAEIIADGVQRAQTVEKVAMTQGAR